MKKKMFEIKKESSEIVLIPSRGYVDLVLQTIAS